MSTIPLATLLPELGEVTPAAIRSWVNAAMAHAAALRQYDSALYPIDPKRQPAAEHLHNAWREWVVEAEAVLQQAREVGLAGTDMDRFRDAIGRARAMLKLTPALIAQRRAQVERGEVFTMEEVRRELRSARGG